MSVKENRLYGIIGIRITPFLGMYFGFVQFYYTISGAELFSFLAINNTIFMRLVAFCEHLL